MHNLIRKVVNKVLLPHSKMSYSQSGEDMIIDYLFTKLKIDAPYYLDVGTNHPKLINNTYFFYLRGYRGVCVEANPILANKIKKIRPQDVVLAKGVSTNNSQDLDFYVFSGKYDGLSTFSKSEAEHWKTVGLKGIGKISYDKIIKVPVISIDSVLENYCIKVPDVISLDVEGLDMEILKTMNFEKFKPTILCVETLQYDENQMEYKNDELIQFVKEKGYEVYADTNINTIFLKKFQ